MSLEQGVFDLLRVVFHGWRNLLMRQSPVLPLFIDIRHCACDDTEQSNGADGDHTGVVTTVPIRVVRFTCVGPWGDVIGDLAIVIDVKAIHIKVIARLTGRAVVCEPWAAGASTGALGVIEEPPNPGGIGEVAGVTAVGVFSLSAVESEGLEVIIVV